MIIEIDFRSRTPIYEQLISHIRSMAATGAAKPDEKLPSVRQLSVELGINPNTIQKAYSELERTGVIYSLSGRGSFISSQTDKLEREHKERLMKDFCRQASLAKEGGISQNELYDAVAQIYGDLTAGGVK